MTILTIESIVSDPKIRRGAPVIVGTGLRVTDVVSHIYYGDKLTPEQFAEHFGVDLGHVHAALAYYHLHQAELDAKMDEDEKRAEELIEQARQKGTLLEFDE